MSFRCPGYLNAKSLSEGGGCREDYVEWFSNPMLSQHRPLIDAIYRTMQYRGDDPVLLVCDISAEACLLFRFTMKSQDRKGRNHQRCEVMMVNQSDKPALLNGEFKAVPDEDNKEFVVDSVNGAALPQCERHRVKNEEFNVYARNHKAYWFKSEGTTQVTSQRQQPTGVSRQPVRSGRTVDCPRKERKIMSKVLFTLLIVSCVFGVWNYFQSADEIECLHKNLEARESEVKDFRSEISNLRNKNERLQAEINKFDKWARTRSNFEQNKVQLKIKFGEIIQDFREVEDLLSHIDEVHKPSYGAGMHAVPSSTPDVNSRTNNSFQTGISMPRREGDRRVDAETESSRLREPKRNDKKKEKSLIEKLNPF